MFLFSCLNTDRLPRLFSFDLNSSLISENPPISLAHGSAFSCPCPIKSRSVSEGLVAFFFSFRLNYFLFLTVV